MQAAWFRRILAGALGAVALGGAPALAGGHQGRAVGLAPTEFVAVAPTAYYVPTSYLLPTSYVETSYVATSYTLSPTTAYVVPTTYTAASYVVPTSYYLPTSYVVPTSYYVPTSYVVPTAFHDYEVVATGFDCATPCDTPCGTATVTAPAPAPAASPAPATQGPAPPKAQGPAPITPAEKPPATLDSIPANEPAGAGDSSATEPTMKRRAGTGAAGAANGTGSGAGAGATTPPPASPAATPLDSSVPSPPVAPVPDRELSTPPAGGSGAGPGVTPLGPNPATPPAGAAKPAPVPAPGTNPPAPTTPPAPANPATGKPPVAPGGDLGPPVELPPPGADEATVRRQVQRPVMSTASRPIAPYRHLVKNGGLTALQGRVVAGEGGDSEEGVQITLSNRAGTFSDRVVTSDALGRYAVWLPDGDWTVRVAMPSGRTYAVSQLTVTRGQITDDQGRDIPSLTITR